MICDCRNAFQNEIASLKEYIDDEITACKRDIVSYKKELDDLRRKMLAIGKKKKINVNIACNVSNGTKLYLP